jgi:transposase InsO family protein
VKDIRRQTRRHFSAEDKIRIVLDGLRDEGFNANWFLSLDDARSKIDSWRRDHNVVRPHTSLGWMTPAEFASSAKVNPGR